MLWTLQRIYLGKPNEKLRSTCRRSTARELFTLVPLAAIVIFLGVYPHADARACMSPRLHRDRGSGAGGGRRPRAWRRR